MLKKLVGIGSNKEENKYIKVFDYEVRVKVPLKKELSKKLPFTPLASRNASATVLCFFGDRNQVWSLLQNLSHGSRSYLASQNGLTGFV